MRCVNINEVRKNTELELLGLVHVADLRAICKYTNTKLNTNLNYNEKSSRTNQLQNINQIQVIYFNLDLTSRYRKQNWTQIKT